jgi:hypothetical protein
MRRSCFFHDDLSRDGSSLELVSVVASMLELYERTTNDQMKNEIKPELKERPHVDRKSGLSDNKIKVFFSDPEGNFDTFETSSDMISIK